MQSRSMIVATLLSLISTAALAHPVPKTADPKPNAVLNASPTEIRIGFSEGFVPAFSGMEVDDASGKAVVTGTASVDPSDDKVMILPVTVKLAAGTYTVKWHAVGDDTHHVGGHYSFQVK
jgi:methionine-rich copper-binding protein CopC